jgi:hypothetical protein
MKAAKDGKLEGSGQRKDFRVYFGVILERLIKIVCVSMANAGGMEYAA